MREGGWTRPLAGLLLLLAALGALARWRWPSSDPALPCSPAQVRWLDAGARLVAVCPSAAPAGSAEVEVEVDPPAGQALAVGRRLDLNRVSAEDLTALPGVGSHLAQALVRERTARGGFRTWEEVDAVPGVGPAKLEVLRGACDLQPLVR
ncbi:MAG TPA: helix-hairpin-helix domain-containing protein [Myxococcales bacterium]|nr:helix-hairpin-helix domain-containing protein [Myxococcales bacterium]